MTANTHGYAQIAISFLTDLEDETRDTKASLRNAISFAVAALANMDASASHEAYLADRIEATWNRVRDRQEDHITVDSAGV